MTNKEDIEKIHAEIDKLEEKEVKELEVGKEEAEKKRLQKRLKHMKFKRTTFGKVVGFLGKGADSLTRPELKDKQGNIIQKGGAGSKLMSLIESKTKSSPKKAVKEKIQERRRQNPTQKAPKQDYGDVQQQINSLVNFGGSTPTPRKKGKKSKPKSVNDFLKSMPQ